jgi:hypothetical protein
MAILPINGHSEMTDRSPSNEAGSTTELSTNIEAPPRAPERGLLQLSVEFSSRDITAGSDFSLFVLVTNPFPIPISIGRVHVSLPSDLKLAGAETVAQSRSRFQQREIEILDKMRRNREILKTPLSNLSTTLEKIHAQFEKPRPPDAILDTLQEKIDEVDKLLQRVEEENSETQISVEGGLIETLNLVSNVAKVRVTEGILNENSKGQIRTVNVQEPWLVADSRSQAREVELQSSLPKEAALQPGNTVVFTTVIRARNAITMSPSKFRLQFSVNYAFLTQLRGSPPAIHTNTISQEISIRAPVYSVMLGSIVGGFLGSLARVLEPSGTTTVSGSIISILLSIILSAAAV